MVEYRIFTNYDDWYVPVRKNDDGTLKIWQGGHSESEAMNTILKDMGIEIEEVEIEDHGDGESKFTEENCKKLWDGE